MPDIMRPSTARQLARSTPIGASPSAAICSGPSIIDSMACATSSWVPVVGCTVSAQNHVRLPLGALSVAGVQSAELVVVHTCCVTLTKP